MTTKTLTARAVGSQVSSASVFARTNASFAVTHRRGSFLTVEPFEDHGEAWGRFMELGRDPNAHGVRITPRGGNRVLQ